MPDIIPAGSSGYELSLLYNQWIALGDTRTRIYSGTLAQRPAADDVFEGAMYRPTDVFGGRAFFISDGTNWKIQNGTIVLAASSVPITKTGAGNVVVVSATIPAGVITSTSMLNITYTAGITNNGGSSNRFIRTGLSALNAPSLQISGTSPPTLIMTENVVQCSSLSAGDGNRITIVDTGALSLVESASSGDFTVSVDAFIAFELVALAAQDVMTLYSYEMTLTNF